IVTFHSPFHRNADGEEQSLNISIRVDDGDIVHVLKVVRVTDGIGQGDADAVLQYVPWASAAVTICDVLACHQREMARQRGVEPLTPKSVAGCSIQLGYGRLCQDCTDGPVGSRPRRGNLLKSPQRRKRLDRHGAVADPGLPDLVPLSNQAPSSSI